MMAGIGICVGIGTISIGASFNHFCCRRPYNNAEPSSSLLP
jgi:hypothetical protein